MYAMMYSVCCACKKIIGFNPNKVPSLMINGSREPICRECAERWNQIHPESARPILDGAYEPCDENEIRWD
jgi:hypothetical protein